MRPDTAQPRTTSPTARRPGGGRAITLVAGALLVGLTLLNAVLIWWFWPTSREFFRDDDSIDVPAADHPAREVLWQTPRRLAAPLNAPMEDYEPRLSWDGLTLFFVRGKAGENADLYFATRTPEGWSAPQPLDAINTSADELGPSPSFDGRELFFYSDREGGVGGYDLWVSQRGPDTWLPPINLGPQVNSPYNDYGAALAPDGVTLYFASNRPQPGDARQPVPDAWPATLREERFVRTYDLFRAERTAQGWTEAAALAALNSPANDGAPCVTPVGDFLYWASDRAGGFGGYDLYRARIRDGTPLHVENLGPLVNSPANELDPGLTQLGFALYFSSDRGAMAEFAQGAGGEGAAAARTADAARACATPKRNYDLYVSESREVYRERVSDQREIDWAGLWSRLWPRLLALLAALLLTWLLWKLLGEVGRRRLSLLARCIVASLLLHTLLMLLFTVWQVGSLVADAFRPGGPIQVALAAPAAADAIAEQLFAPIADAAEVPATAVELVRHEAPPTRLPPVERIELQPPPTVAMESPRSLARAEAVDAPAPRAVEVVHAPSVPPPAASSLRMIEVSLPKSEQARPIEEPAIASPAPVAGPVVAQHVVHPTPDAPSADLNSPAIELPRTNVEIRPVLAVAVPSPADAPARRSATDAPEPAAAAILLPSARNRPEIALPAAVAAAPVAPEEPTPVVEALPTPMPTSRPVFVDAFPTPALPAHSPRLEMAVAPAAIVPETPRSLAARVISPPPDAPPPATLQAVALLPPPRMSRGVRPVEIPVSLPSESSRSALRPTKPVEPSPAPQPREVALRPSDAALTPQAATAALRAGSSLAQTPATSAAAILPPRTLIAPPRVVDARPHAASPAEALPSPSGVVHGLASLVAAARPALALPSETELPPEYVQRQPENRAQIVQRMGGTPETERAVNAALAWLARVQSTDGRWDGAEFAARCAGCDGATEYEIDTALTGLSLLCFLGAGHTHVSDGPYRETVQKALAWLAANQAASGDLRRGEETMYSHGMASIALSEAYGMTKDAALRPVVQKAIDFIVAARNSRTGAWRYEPGQDGDTSVLGWQVMALTSARQAGIDVPDESLSGAQRWLERVARPAPGRGGERGLFAYRPDRKATRSMTAEGVFVLQLTGASADDPRLATASRYLLGELPRWDGRPNTYYWYYATLALFQQQHEGWERWNAALQAALLPSQRTDAAAAGSWDAVGEWANVGGRIYQTALCTLMLEVYYRYLPMYAREVGREVKR